MTNLTRSAFLRLSAATTAVAASAPAARAKAQPTPKSARPMLIKGADVLSMDPKIGEVAGADVLVVDGKIAAIGKNLSASGAEVIDAVGHILMPGMIDGHRHVWEIADAGRLTKFHPKGYATYQEWKMRTIVCLTPEDNHLAGLIGGLQAIDSGVTSLIDFAHGQPTKEQALGAARGLKESGVAGWFAFQLGVSSNYGPGSTVTLAQAHALRIARSTETHWGTAAAIQSEVLGGSDLLKMGLCPSTGLGDPIDLVKAEWTRARATGVKMIAAHIHRPDKPHPVGHVGHRDSGIPDLFEAGLLGPDFHVAHGNQLTDQELGMLRQTGGMICATAMGEFPYVSAGRGASVHGRARAAGVPAGVGVDVSLALPSDYFEHVRAGFWNLYLEPEGRKINGAYTSEDVLDFATRMGAQAIGLGDVTGTLTVGKRADMLLLRTDRIGFGMLGTLADRVVTFAQSSDIDSVWIGGVAKKRGGRMVGHDFTQLKRKLAAAQARFGPQAQSIKFS